jgi:hypothetical protein
MSLSLLFMANAVVAILFGIGFLIAPASVLNIYGVDSSPALESLGQYYGAALIAWGVVAWLARRLSVENARATVVPGFAIGDVLALIAAVLGVINGVTGSLGWLNVVLFAAFAAGYGYFWLMQPGGAPRPAMR